MLEILVFAVLIVVTGLLGIVPIYWRWIAIIVWFFGFLAFVGRMVTRDQSEGNKSGRWMGILIDNRLKMSLSRFQIILWTVLTLSSFTVVALDRSIPLLANRMPALAPAAAVPGAPFSPLEIQLPQELLIAMGISTTSMAGASWITSKKTETQSSKVYNLLEGQAKVASDKVNRAGEAVTNANNLLAGLAKRLQQLSAPSGADSQLPPERLQLELDRVSSQTETAKGALEAARADLEKAQNEQAEFEKGRESRKGDVHVNDNISQAVWSDLFRGELVSNFRVVDIAKVQMFFLTVILIILYGTMVWGMLGVESSWQTQAQVSLPAFSETMVVLLGISHLGYLAIKQTGS